MHADYQQAQFRQYQRLTKAIKPDMDVYKRSVEKWGDDFSSDSLAYAGSGVASREGIDRMVEDLQAQYVFAETEGRKAAWLRMHTEIC